MQELMNTLYDAAQQLAAEDIGQWPRWITYVLEVLQDSAGGEEYEAFLNDLRVEVGAGQWR